MDPPATQGGRFPLRVALLLVPLALLVSLMQKEMSRPEVLGMYMDIRGHEVYAPRLLPRVLLEALTWMSSGFVSLRYANYLLQFASAWGALWFVFLLARPYVRPITALAASLLAALFTLFGFGGLAWGYAYPYDLPIFLLSAVGLWAIATRRFVVLAVSVFLGTLIKETMLWIVAAYFLVHLRRDVATRALVLRSSLLAALFLVAYLLPRAWIHAPGGATWITALPTAGGEPRIFDNLRELLFLRYRGGVQHVYMALVLHLAPLVSIRRLPAELRRFYAATLVFLLPHLVVSNIWEIRLFNELIPLGAVGTLWVFERSTPSVSNPPARTSPG